MVLSSGGGGRELIRSLEVTKLKRSFGAVAPAAGSEIRAAISSSVRSGTCVKQASNRSAGGFSHSATQAICGTGRPGSASCQSMVKSTASPGRA